MYCEICKEETKYDVNRFFVQYHLKKVHKMSPKEYYDTFIDKEKKCLECNGETKFFSIVHGYQSYCSKDCSHKSPIHRSNISKSFETRDIESGNLKRKNTCIEKYGVDYIGQLEESKQKIKNTCLERYGVISNLLTTECFDARWASLNDNMDEINEKRRKFWTDEAIDKVNTNRMNTCLERYGVHSTLKLPRVRDSIKKTRIDKGLSLNDIESTEFKKFSKTVRTLSTFYYDELFNLWNGLDYYTGENLLELSKVNSKIYKPSVDHKTSIYYGYKNNMSIYQLADISNLCICGKGINSTKNTKCEIEFKDFLIERNLYES